MTGLSVRGVSRLHGSTAAVDDVSFDVADGTITGLLGPNGSGKTTLIRRILGLDDGAGTALFAGRAYAELPDPLRTVGTVLDTGGIHPGTTARRHLAALAWACGLPSTRVAGALALVGLSDAAEVQSRALSLGMRQRLALAAALLCRPEFLVLDEPTNGLDPHGIQWLAGLLHRHVEETGGAVLISSHLVPEIERLADHVVVMSHGRVAAVGTTTEVVRAHSGDGTPVVAVRCAPADVLAPHLVASGASVQVDRGMLRVQGLSLHQVAMLARDSGVLVLELYAIERTLEDTYLAMGDK